MGFGEFLASSGLGLRTAFLRSMVLLSLILSLGFSSPVDYAAPYRPLFLSACCRHAGFP